MRNEISITFWRYYAEAMYLRSESGNLAGELNFHDIIVRYSQTQTLICDTWGTVDELVREVAIR